MAKSPDILTEIVCDFPQYLQKNESNYMQKNKKFHVYMTGYINLMSTEKQYRKFKESDIWSL